MRHLEDNGVIERHTGAGHNVTEYILTEAGSDLADMVEQLGTWAIKWVFNDPNRDELDPALFLWKMHHAWTIVNSRADVPWCSLTSLVGEDERCGSSWCPEMSHRG